MIDIVSVVQLSIGPVVLISGIGLLLLSMTNRYARIVDRIREMCERNQEVSKKQVMILYRRARLQRLAITFTVGSIMTVALLILSLFTHGLLGDIRDYLISALFSLSMLLLLAGLLLFILDLTLSLKALKIVIGRSLKERIR